MLQRRAKASVSETRGLGTGFPGRPCGSPWRQGRRCWEGTLGRDAALGLTLGLAVPSHIPLTKETLFQAAAVTSPGAAAAPRAAAGRRSAPVHGPWSPRARGAPCSPGAGGGEAGGRCGGVGEAGLRCAPGSSRAPSTQILLPQGAPWDNGTFVMPPTRRRAGRGAASPAWGGSPALLAAACPHCRQHPAGDRAGRQRGVRLHPASLRHAGGTAVPRCHPEQAAAKGWKAPAFGPPGKDQPERV